MRDFVRIAIGIFTVFLFHTIFSRISPSVLLLFNVFSLVVVYFAMEKGEIFGSYFGAGCGLLQDYFSFGVYGVAGLAKTITGFLAGYISKKIDVHPPMRSFFFLFLLLSFDLILWALLYSFIVPENINTGGGLIYAQPLASAILGSSVFFLLNKMKKSKY
jgi:rod shape-determining protein MreD